MKKFIKILSLKLNLSLVKFPLSVFLSITIYLSLFSYHKLFWIILSIICIIPFVIKPKYFISTIIFLCLALMIHLITQQHFHEKTINGIYTIKKNTSMGPIIYDEHSNIFIKTKKHFNIGDKVKVYGKLSKIINTSHFDIVTYFKSLNVEIKIQHPFIKIIETTDDFRVKLRNFIISGGRNYNKITPLLFLGMKTNETKDIYMLSIKMNIVHLFVISGFHISLFFIVIVKVLTKLKVKKNISWWIPLFPIYIYLFILGFPISATRAVILVTFAVVNKTILKSKFNSLQLLGLTMGMMFSMNPRSIYSLSFIFTFIATFVVLMVNNYDFKNTWTKFISISFFAYSSNVIIVLYINHYFSIFGLLYGIVLSPLFIFMYIFTLVFFPVKSIVEYIDFIFIEILLIFNQTNILIHIKDFSITYVYLSYGILLSCLIILITWNSYTDKKDSLLIKKLSY